MEEAHVRWRVGEVGWALRPVVRVVDGAAYVVGSPDEATPASGAREVLEYFGTSAGNFVFFNGSLVLLCPFFFLWFLGVLYGVLRRAEGLDGVLSALVLTGGVFFITLQCAGNAVEIMHPATVQRFVSSQTPSSSSSR